MKFYIEQKCECGGVRVFEAYGEGKFDTAYCSSCDQGAHCFDPLSVDVAAERLLHRCAREIDKGDYSIAILVGAMAVEYFITSLYCKIKKMLYFKGRLEWPAKEQEQAWKQDENMRKGFKKKCDFVCVTLTQTTFDKYTCDHNHQNLFANPSGKLPIEFVQDELFERRNAIAHRGFVNSSRADAEISKEIAVNVISILRKIDREYYKNC